MTSPRLPRFALAALLAAGLLALPLTGCGESPTDPDDPPANVDRPDSPITPAPDGYATSFEKSFDLKAGASRAFDIEADAPAIVGYDWLSPTGDATPIELADLHSNTALRANPSGGVEIHPRDGLLQFTLTNHADQTHTIRVYVSAAAP